MLASSRCVNEVVSTSSKRKLTVPLISWRVMLHSTLISSVTMPLSISDLKGNTVGQSVEVHPVNDPRHAHLHINLTAINCMYLVIWKLCKKL